MKDKEKSVKQLEENHALLVRNGEKERVLLIRNHYGQYQEEGKLGSPVLLYFHSLLSSSSLFPLLLITESTSSDRLKTNQNPPGLWWEIVSIETSSCTDLEFPGSLPLWCEAAVAVIGLL